MAQEVNVQELGNVIAQALTGYFNPPVSDQQPQPQSEATPEPTTQPQAESTEPAQEETKEQQLERLKAQVAQAEQQQAQQQSELDAEIKRYQDRLAQLGHNPAPNPATDQSNAPDNYLQSGPEFVSRGSGLSTL